MPGAILQVPSSVRTPIIYRSVLACNLQRWTKKKNDAWVDNSTTAIGYNKLNPKQGCDFVT